jgi:hypothetical protein
VESTTPSPPVDPSPSEPAGSDVDLATHRVDSIAEVLRLLESIGWAGILVLEDGTPNRLLIWESGGHLHARTDYVGAGEKLSIVQAEGEGLPPGGLVMVRGEDGVKADGNLYWVERGFVIALSPGRKSLATSLTWMTP